MSVLSIQHPTEVADTNYARVIAYMEDGLLLHVAECAECLDIAIRRRGRLIDQGCASFRRLAERQRVTSDVSQSMTLAEGHLAEDVMEEYYFERLSASDKDKVDQHLASCETCRKERDAHQEFVLCLKHALADWSGPLKDARLTTVKPALVNTPTVAPQFTQEAILSARESLPVSRLVGLEALRLLDKENVSLDALERVLKGDPVLSAHLIRVANSALMSYGTETRTVNQAIGRIGMERTKLHLWGLAVKRMFQSPALQKIWNHSILAAQVSRQLAEMTHVIPPDEASLIALVHDIGQIVLVNLGASYERARTQRLARGLFPVQAEQQLCGATHAGVGADLLAYWKFAPDMVEAVRFHHSPTDKTSPLAALLYVAETWLDSQEDLCDLTLHRACMRRLGLTSADLQTVGVKHSPDLELLRFAA